MSRILFIGLGNMGAPMALKLAAVGHEVALQDLNADRVAAVASTSENARPASECDRADIDIVITMLPTSEIVEAALESDGLIEALPQGALVIDMSSAEPSRSRALAARLQSQGLRYLDAPVSGGVRGAEAGTLAIMVGGNPADVEAAMPLMQVMGGSVVHVGMHGAGHAAKALNNLVSAASVVATIEALHTAESFGIESSQFVEVLNHSSGRSVTSEQKVERFMLSGTFDSGFPIGLMSKDVTIAVDLASQLGSKMDLGSHVAQIWQTAAVDFATKDHTRMYEVLGRAATEPTEGER